MRKTLLLLTLFAGYFSIALAAPPSNFCHNKGNLAIYSNYDGGILYIKVDQNIPNLKIGICTYEPITVTIGGAYAGNVTQVIYAGFNSDQNNNNCHLGNYPTTITGVSNNIITINPADNPPQVGYTPHHGHGAGNWGGIMIGAAGQCDTTQDTGGVNTPDEIVYYFTHQTGGTLLFHQTQYSCWVRDTVSISEGGNCCIEPATTISCTGASAADTIAGSAIVCQGQTAVNYTTPSISNATGYSWTLPAGATIAAGDSTNAITVNFSSSAQSGTITVTGFNNCGTGTGASLPVSVDVPAPPSVIAADSLICSSDSAHVCIAGSFNSYHWNTEEQTSCIYTKQAGDCWATVTDAHGCTAISGHVNVHVYAVSSVSVVVRGDTLTSYGALSYQWYKNDSLIPGADQPMYVAGSNGSYGVEVTDTNGCKQRSGDINTEPYGFTQLSPNALSIYPNPAGEQLFIQAPGFQPELNLVYTMDGKKILEQKFTHRLDISSLPAGIYFIEARNNFVSLRKRFVKL